MYFLCNHFLIFFFTFRMKWILYSVVWAMFICVLTAYEYFYFFFLCTKRSHVQFLVNLLREVTCMCFFMSVELIYLKKPGEQKVKNFCA